MKILNIDNRPFDLTEIPEIIEGDLRYSVLDNTDPEDPDFFFLPLLFLETFSSPAMLLRIGKSKVQVPLDWSVVVGDQDSGIDPEVLPLTSINERGFSALLYNPVNGFRYEYQDIEILNIYHDVKWYFPKLRPGQFLSIPIEDSAKPLCAFFCKELGRTPDTINLSRLIG